MAGLLETVNEFTVKTPADQGHAGSSSRGGVTRYVVGFGPAAPVSVNLYSTFERSSLPGRSCLDVEESTCCEGPFHRGHVPDLAH